MTTGLSSSLHVGDHEPGNSILITVITKQDDRRSASRPFSMSNDADNVRILNAKIDRSEIALLCGNTQLEWLAMSPA